MVMGTPHFSVVEKAVNPGDIHLEHKKSFSLPLIFIHLCNLYLFYFFYYCCCLKIININSKTENTLT